MRCSSRARRATLPEAPRLATGIVVAALLRRMAAEGGQGTILHRGDAQAGAILIVTMARGSVTGVLERTLGADGYALGRSGPADPTTLDGWLERRRLADPDLWVVELEGDGESPQRVARDVMA
ncbi:MAG: DUF1491 family protein [Sphingomonas fennica]